MTDHAHPSSYRSSADRTSGSMLSMDGSAVTARPDTSSTDMADTSTLQEEVANLKAVLSKYVAGRRKRRRENMTQRSW
jgi:hypothetical protein